MLDRESILSFGDKDVSSVSMSLYNFSPNSNKQAVIDYWKSQNNPIEIKDIDIEKIYYSNDK